LQNYASGTASTTLAITPATPTVSVTGGTFTYDSKPHSGVAAITGVNGEVLGPVVITYNGSTDAPIDAGTYIVQAAFAGNGNYSVASADAALLIEQAVATLSVTCGSFTYDGNAHAATVTVVGPNGEALGPVLGLMSRISATALLVNPWLSNFITSRSRGINPTVAGIGPRTAWGPPGPKTPAVRASSSRSTTALPRRTDRIAASKSSSLTVLTT